MSNISQIIQQKGLNKRQKDFVNILIQKGGEFTNNDLAKIWGGKTFPSALKSKLLENPPLLISVSENERPKKYKIVNSNDLKMQQKSLSSFSDINSTPTIKTNIVEPSNNLTSTIENLEKRINNLEQKFNNLIYPFKKIKLGKFKDELYKEYDYLNPQGDISGVDYEILKRRICRSLEISFDYFDDLIYDLQQKEQTIIIQFGREKKYIHIRIKG